MSRFTGTYAADWKAVATATKSAADWRCVRCGHAHEPSAGYTLTIHHADGDKANNAWWNLLPLCQRCHLSIQGRVIMHRQFFLPHSEWFRPYVAGWYAHCAGLPEDEAYVRRNMDALLDLGQHRIGMAMYQAMEAAE